VVQHEAGYPTRIMHHDCKISNILFENGTGAVICPVDLDTVMPGKYFSDIGDMIRTMACTEEENSKAWELIDVKKDNYTAIINGYLEGMRDNLTASELKHIHKPGLLLTYMQCIRFVTDFLNNDIYYRTTYPEQNLNRALNQLILLEKLETFTNNVS
jgi:Ser/Thr protein kinase RdoA (MazF antagonist)